MNKNRPGGYSRKLDKLVFGSLVFCITAICSAVFFSSIGFGSEVLSDVSAADADLNVEINPVISIRVVKNNADIDTLALDVNPIAAGRFVKDDLSILVSTSNETGYTLTMSDNDNDSSMRHTDNSVTAAIASVSSTGDESNFPVNSWGYSLSDISSATQQFSAIPILTSAATIKTTSDPVTEDQTNVTFAAKVDTSIPAGTYQDVIVFSATTNYVPAPHAINFNRNSNSYNPNTVVTGTDPAPIDAKHDETIALPANPYTRPGYRFLGWDKNAGATTATYAAGSTASNIGDENETVILYAIWQPQNQLTTITNMQQMTSEICTSTYTPTNVATVSNTDQYFSADNVPQRTLSDIRDSKTYVVRKLADGNCWMVQNLGLDLSTSVTLTSQNTDLNSKASWLPINNTQTQLIPDDYWWLKNYLDVPMSYNPGIKYFPNGKGFGVVDSTTGTMSGYNTVGQPWEFVGNYYNWNAITAGAGNSAITSGAVNDSICPSGWRVPGIDGDKSFTVLFSVYGVTLNTSAGAEKIISNPINLVRAGWTHGTTENERGTGATFWLNQAFSSNDSYYLSSGGDVLNPAAINSRSYGFTARCVAR